MGEEGDWDGMANLLREALEERSEDPAVLCWLGVAERELGLDGIAYERFRRCLAEGPEDPRILATTGNGIAAFDDPEAESALRAAATLGPSIPMTRWMYGAYLSREGLFEDAMRELDAARELDPDNYTVRLERGVALALAGKVEEACAEFERSVELDPADGWGLVLLGLGRIETGDVEDAASVLAEGARERPEDVEAQCLAALALSAAGEADEALVMLERGRLRSEGVDRLLVSEAELRIDEGAEASLTFLHSVVAPGAFRERLMTRP